MKDNQSGFIFGMIYGAIFTWFICNSRGGETPLWQWIVVIVIWIPIIYIRISYISRKMKDKKKES